MILIKVKSCGELKKKNVNYTQPFLEKRAFSSWSKKPLWYVPAFMINEQQITIHVKQTYGIV